MKHDLGFFSTAVWKWWARIAAAASNPSITASAPRRCQWKALPKERFGSASAIHKRFLEWEKAGLFESIWRAGLAEYDQMQGIAWRWQSIDGAMFKAPLAQESGGKNPTIGGKQGSKRHLLVDGRGVPLSLIVTGANAHDVTQLDAVLAAKMVKRKLPKSFIGVATFLKPIGNRNQR